MVRSAIAKTCGIVVTVLGCSISVSAANAVPPVIDCDKVTESSDAVTPNSYVEGGRCASQRARRRPHLLRRQLDQSVTTPTTRAHLVRGMMPESDADRVKCSARRNKRN
jgi:hypothetical protein